MPNEEELLELPKRPSGDEAWFCPKIPELAVLAAPFMDGMLVLEIYCGG